MSETTLKLLELIKEGKKLNEICTELNKTPKQIFNHLTLLKTRVIYLIENITILEEKYHIYHK